ncbi:MAG: tetratricopeptide repeat protein [Chloroflexi bacterium]|nr:tetratricopeptide repeat protein [Chloroflexota bacterium]
MPSSAPEPQPTAEREIAAARRYAATLREDPKAIALAEAYLPLAVEGSAEGDAGGDALLARALAGEHLVLVGRPGCGKTTLLRVAALELARRYGAAGARLPIYLDLATVRQGEGVEELALRSLAKAGLSERSLPSLAPVTLLLDNLDRATDVYLLENLELLIRAGGQAGPRVVAACRSADWPNYRLWFEDLPQAAIGPLAPGIVAQALQRLLPAESAGAALRWVERDAGLGAALGSPRTLQAFLETVRAQPPERWHRRQVMDALLETLLSGLPAAERGAYLNALRDVAVGGLGGGPLFEVDTVAMGLGVTRDDMIRTGAVEPHGSALGFVEPMLATHLVARALDARAGHQPAGLMAQLAALEPSVRETLMAHVYGLVELPEAFLEGLLLAGDEGPELVAACLASAALPGGARGPRAMVDRLCDAAPRAAGRAFYQLAEALRRQGLGEAADIAARAALEREGGAAAGAPRGGGAELADAAAPDESEPTAPAIFDRPDVDAPPPIGSWLHSFIGARNRGLALRGGRDLPGAREALLRARAALDRVEGDLVFEQGLLAAEAGDHQAALSAFEQALAEDPRRARYLYHYGRTLIALDRAAEAIELLQRAREAAPGQAEIEARLAEAYRARGWIEEALAAFETARKLAPQVPDYDQAAGELQAELGDLEAAAEAMQRATTAAPDAAAWHDALGQVLSELGRGPAALRAFRRAAALAPEVMGYQRHLGRALLAAGDAAAAVEALERACRLDPEAPGPVADLGMALAEAGDIEASIETLRLAVAMDDAWPADQLKLAQLLRGSGVLDEALDHAQRAASMAPASVAAQAELGQVHEARGEYREALAAFVTAAEQAPTEARHREDMADAYAQLGDALGAAQATEQAAWLDPESLSALERLAGLHEASGDLDAALEALRQAVGLAPERAELQRRAGQLLLRLGQTEAAIGHLDQATRQAPEDAGAWFALGQALQADGDPERALGALRRAARLAPGQADYLGELVGVARALGRPNEARSAADAALQLAPQRADLYAIKAEVEAAAGELEAAREAYRRALALDPEASDYRLRLAELQPPEDPALLRRLLEQVASRAPDAEVSRRLAELHGSQGAWLQAADEYARALAQRPDDAWLVAARSAALRKAGRVDEAVAELEAARARLGDPGVLMVELALAQAAVGRDAEAMQAFAAAADDPALTPEASLSWSRLAMRQGEVGPAIEAARRALAARPDWAEAFAALGDAYAAAGLTEAALTAVRGAATLAPRDARYRELQARLSRELGRHDEAIAALEEGIAVDPGQARLHYELGCAFEGQGWLQEARGAFARAVEAEPQAPRYLRALARHLAQDDLEAAIRALRVAAQADPEDADTAFQLGRLLGRAGDDEAARRAFKRALELEPEEPDYHRALGQCLARIGRPDAVEHLRRSVALAPKSAEAQVALGEWYVAAGRQAAALVHYVRAIELEPERADLRLMQGALELALGRPADAPADAPDAAVGPLAALPAADVNATTDEADADLDLQDLGLALERGRQLTDDGWTIDLAAPALAPPLAISDAERHRLVQRLELGLAEAAPQEEAEIALVLARLQGRGGDPGRALAAAERAADRDGAPATLLALGWARLLCGEASAALEALGMAAALGEAGPELGLLEGHAHARLGDAGRAAEAFGRAAALAPQAATPRLRLAEVERERDDPAAALAAYRAAYAIEATPALAAAIGHAAAAAGAAEEARDLLEAAALRWQRSGEVLVALAGARRAAGDIEAAIQALDQALAAEPERAEWQAELGRALWDAGRLEQARERFQRAAELEPSQRAHRFDAAELDLALGDRARARASLEAARSAWPGSARAALLLARLSLDEGQAQAACEILAQAVDHAPQRADLHFWLGQAARAAGDPGAAQRHLEQAVQIDDRFAQAYLALGDAYLDAGATDDAVQAYEQALVGEPGLSEARLRLARACALAGLHERAAQQLDAAVAQAPSDPEPWRVMGQAWLEAEQADRAVAAFAAAIERAPEDAALHLEAGKAYRQMRDYESASRRFRRALHLAPTSKTAYAQYAATSAMHFVERAVPLGEDRKETGS